MAGGERALPGKRTSAEKVSVRERAGPGTRSRAGTGSARGLGGGASSSPTDGMNVRMRWELEYAQRVLHAQGLFKASRFAAELLASLQSDGSDRVGGDDAEEWRTEYTDVRAVTSQALMLSRSYFDCKEFKRAARVLEEKLAEYPAPSASTDSARDTMEEDFTGDDEEAHFRRVQGAEGSFFLYADYMAGYQRQAVANAEKSGPLGRWTVQNEASKRIISLVESRGIVGYAEPFSQYVYALALLDSERTSEARQVLIESLTKWPWNWSAWLLLQGLCSDFDTVMALSLPEHWMRDLFYAALCLELHNNDEGLARYTKIRVTFPNNAYIMQQIATAHYNLREFDQAQEIFEELYRRDPDRLEGMDIYSNILYVKEMLPQLSHLAHAAVGVDKFRPETCCVVGNYYSLKSQHEKAVAYFKRALRVNPKYLSAWTLMGHEYVELKHPRAAINCYRRAVDINPRDYRAWYGLGQTYEILAMPFYALYYYRQATQLRPMDARMWCAMGGCYETEVIAMPEAAIRCYLRAEKNNDREGIALPKLGKLYMMLGKMNKAAECYKKALERMDREQPTGAGEAAGSEQVECLLVLAAHYKDCGRLVEAEHYCMRLLDCGGQARDQAKAILRELHSEQQQQMRGQTQTEFSRDMSYE